MRKARLLPDGLLPHRGPGLGCRSLPLHLGRGYGKTLSLGTVGCRLVRGRPSVTSGASQQVRAKGALGELCEVGICPGPGQFGNLPLALCPGMQLQLLCSHGPWRFHFSWWSLRARVLLGAPGRVSQEALPGMFIAQMRGWVERWEQSLIHSSICGYYLRTLKGRWSMSPCFSTTRPQPNSCG